VRAVRLGILATVGVGQNSLRRMGYEFFDSAQDDRALSGGRLSVFGGKPMVRAVVVHTQRKVRVEWGSHLS
jgi:hypothetical protein